MLRATLVQRKRPQQEAAATASFPKLGFRRTRSLAAGLVLLTASAAGAVEYPSVHGDDRSALAVEGTPQTVGAWEAPRPWPVIGIHAFLLPTGEVLHYAYSSAHGAPEERHYYDGSHAVVWNPEGDSFFDISWDGTVFCSGHSFLADGRLFVTGGLAQQGCLTQGRIETWFLDPFTLDWERGPDMRKPRYYPTNLTLGDGRVMILSGNNESCAINPRMEIFDPSQGTGGVIRNVPSGNRQMDIYPRVHQLADGRVVHVGPEESTWVWSPDSQSWTRLSNTRLSVQRLEGASFVVPGNPFQIMTCGGYAELNRIPTETCETIDFSVATPTWRAAASMHRQRAHANAVLLPDGKVLVVGGGAHDLYADPDFNAELYDPERDTWTLLPAQRWGRMYHSTAILLPDGRVLSAGQDEFPESQNDSGAWAEFYKPAYLFGAQPKIRSAPDEAALGGDFVLRAKGAKKVRSAALMGLAAMTHSVNMGQRYVELDFEHLDKAELEIHLPDNANLLPPGYYMLFVINKKGRPSKAAHMLHVTEPTGEARRTAPAGPLSSGRPDVPPTDLETPDGPPAAAEPSPVPTIPRARPVGEPADRPRFTLPLF